MPFIALGPLFYPPRYPARTPAREVIVAEGGHLLGVNVGYGDRGITSDLYCFFILLCTCQVFYYDHVYFRISAKINFLFSQKENSSTRALSLEPHQSTPCLCWPAFCLQHPGDAAEVGCIRWRGGEWGRKL